VIVKLIRSWPAKIPTGRAYVIDTLERLVIDNHHYGPLADIDDDILLIEWDMAVDKQELIGFAGRARATPGRVLVAPYRIYYPNLPWPVPIWAHRHWAGEPAGMVNITGATPVDDGDEYCQLFGLGLVYLPRGIVRAYFADAYSAHFGDTEFSSWHYRNVAHDVPIDWSTRPVHLNYRLEEGDVHA
jgi:hypothetical protein